MADEINSNPKEVELEALIVSRIRQMGEHMHAQIKDGVVHLSGTVNEFEAKREIMTLVQSIAGVHEVSNNIRVARVSDGEFENYS